MTRTAGTTAADTRVRILDAARTLFAEQGYAGTSVRDLTERLAITKAALYYHFPGKADVLLALVRPVLAAIDELAERVERDADPDRRAVLHEFASLLARFAPSIFSLVTDPSARRDLGEKLRAEQHFERLQTALAGGGDPIPARCALGAVHGGLLGTMAARKRAGELPPSVSDAQVGRIVAAALAAWSAAEA